jgi:F-type H+-transporting ATPase subunit b
MEINATTVALEILNFLVLLWILKRFLYRPVLDVIEQRRAGIEKTLTDAQSKETEAERLQALYEGRLSEWSTERASAKAELAREIDAEKARRMTELQEKLALEQERLEAARDRRAKDDRQRLELAAMVQGTQFATRLLKGIADSAVEERLIAQFLAELDKLPEQRRKGLQEQVDSSRPASVSSAFPVSETQRKRLSDLLHGILAIDLPLEFERDPALIAGIRVKIGSRVLGLNIQDELEGFANLSHDG